MSKSHLHPHRAGTIQPLTTTLAAALALGATACGGKAASALDPADTLLDIPDAPDGGQATTDAAFGVPGDGDGLEWGSVIFGDAVSVARDGSGICHVDGTGQVWCQGGNEHGQLGSGIRGGINGAPLTTSTDSKVVGIDDALEVYAPNPTQRCALTRGGSFACWGKLGNVESLEPVVLGPPSGAGRARVVRGLYDGTLLEGVALLTDQNQVCLLEIGSDTQCWEVVPDAKSFAVTKGTLHVLAGSGDVFACSAASTSNVASCEKLALPAQAKALVAFASLASGYTGLALLDDGRVACWGKCPMDAPGGLSDVPEPRAIPGLDSVARFVSGTCTVDHDDTVRCWGSRVRSSDSSGYSRPERIGTLADFEAIVGVDFAGTPNLGLTTDGETREIAWP